jgi:hypothetical protein
MSEKGVTPHSVDNAADPELALEVSAEALQVQDGLI